MYLHGFLLLIVILASEALNRGTKMEYIPIGGIIELNCSVDPNDKILSVRYWKKSTSGKEFLLVEQVPAPYEMFLVHTSVFPENKKSLFKDRLGASKELKGTVRPTDILMYTGLPQLGAATFQTNRLQRSRRLPVTRNGNIKLSRVRSLEWGLLQILNARREDSGVYICAFDKMTGRNIRNNKEIASVNVLDPPIRPLVSVKDTPVGSGHSVILTCSLRKPVLGPYELTWFKRRGALPETDHILDSSSGLLKLTNPRPQDAGEYACNLTTRVGISTSTSVHIYIKHVGESTKFRCLSPGNVTYSTEYKWHRVNGTLNNKRILMDKSSGVMIVTDIQPGDAGLYKCIVNNSAELTESSVVQLLVHYIEVKIDKTSKLASGGKLRLICRARGYPSNITFLPWIHERNGYSRVIPTEEIDHKTSIVTLKYTSQKDNGVYTCRAENGIYNSSDDVTMFLGAISETFHYHWMIVGLLLILLIMAGLIIYLLKRKISTDRCAPGEVVDPLHSSHESYEMDQQDRNTSGYEEPYCYPIENLLSLSLSNKTSLKIHSVQGIFDEWNRVSQGQDLPRCISAPAPGCLFEPYESLANMQGHDYTQLLINSHRELNT